MGKRYYCDYCDKSFPYSVEARKKHYSGHQHRVAKLAYYDKIKSPSQIYHDEVQKQKCRRFFSGQSCTFGDSCIYSHATDAKLEELKANAEKESGRDERRNATDISVGEIEAKLENIKNPHLKTIEKLIRSFGEKNPRLASFQPLPPSLQQTFALEDIRGSGFSSWG